MPAAKRKLSTQKKRWVVKKQKPNPRSYVNRVQLTKPYGYERKWFQIGMTPIQMNPGVAYAMNPFYLMTQGAGQDQRIGLIINDVKLYVDVRYQHFGTTNLTAGKYDQTSFRCTAFANPTQWHQTVANVPEVNTAGTGTTIPIGNVFLDSGVDRCSHSYLNKDFNKILYDSMAMKSPISHNTLTAAPNGIMGGIIHKRFQISLGDLRFTSNGLSYLRDDNVYLWTVADALYQTGTAANDLMGVYTMNVMVTWRDA